MARCFHTLEDGSLVEVTDKNKRKYKPDKFEDEPRSILKTVGLIFLGLFLFLIWIVMVILKVFVLMVKR